MDQNNTIEELLQLVSKLEFDDIKAYSAKSLSDRFAAAVDQNRHDHVIRNIAGILEQKASHDPSQPISAKQIYALYETFVNLNPQTRFKEIFADLLPGSANEVLSQDRTKTGADKMRVGYTSDYRGLDEIKGGTLEVDELYESPDQLVPESLKPLLNVFDTPTIAGVDIFHHPELAPFAAKLVQQEVSKVVEAPVTANLKLSTKEYLLYSASFDTPAGKCAINVPVEIVDSQPLFPSCFATNDKVYDLSAEGLVNYASDLQKAALTKQAGLKIKAETFALDIVRDLVAGKPKIEIGEDDHLTLEQPRVAMPSELSDIEAILENAVLRKESTYNDEAIETGRSYTEKTLGKIGFKNAQVRFAGDIEGGLKFATTLQMDNEKLEVIIPVEVQTNSILLPSVVATKDMSKFYDLSHDGLHRLFADNKQTVTPVRYSGLMLDSTYGELQKVIHRAAFDKELDKATEALNVIQDKFGEEAHIRAVADYQHWLVQASCDYSSRCTSCPHYRPRGTVSTIDHCGLLRTACRNVEKDTNTGICHRAAVDYTNDVDEQFSGVMITSQIKFT